MKGVTMDNFGPFNKCEKYVEKFRRKYLRIHFLFHVVLNMFTFEKYLYVTACST
jgi:hypothetical protein